MTAARRSESAEVIRAVAHRWFDQVLGTCDPLWTTQVHNEHRALCNALDRMTVAPAAYGHDCEHTSLQHGADGCDVPGCLCAFMSWAESDYDA